MAPKPLDPVGVDVRRELLHRRRQVDDHLGRRRRPPLRRHALADLDGVVELCVVEALRRVLEHDLRGRLSGEPLAQRRPAHREAGDPVTFHPEDDPPLRHRRRVVEVHDRAPGAVDRLVRALDQLGPRLGEHRDRHVRGDQVLLDERPDEVEVGLRRRREADLDLLQAEREQQVEEAPLASGVHRIDERLVAVAEVGRAPDRRAIDNDIRPGAVGQLNGLVRTVLLKRHRHRAQLLMRADFSRWVRVHGYGYVVTRFPLAGKEEGKQEQAGSRSRCARARHCDSR